MTDLAPLLDRAAALVARYDALGLTLATAESCTGGLITGLLTEVPGSSAVVERGFVTYSNNAKIELLNVPEAMLYAHGAVSEPVARAMAAGAIAGSRADCAVAVTGIAGPGGGSSDKPVGLVHVAAQRRGHPSRHRECRFGALTRGEIRARTIATALDMLDELAELLD